MDDAGEEMVFVDGEGGVVRFVSGNKEILQYIDEGVGWEIVCRATELWFNTDSGEVSDRQGAGGVFPREHKRQLFRNLKEVCRVAGVPLHVTKNELSRKRPVQYLPPESYAVGREFSKSTRSTSSSAPGLPRASSPKGTANLANPPPAIRRPSKRPLAAFGTTADFEDTAADVAAARSEEVARMQRLTRSISQSQCMPNSRLYNLSARVAQFACAAVEGQGKQGEDARQELLVASAQLFKEVEAARRP
eukprot:Hpha_TRINITY_DN20321_c0_g1::TRINITY_DN20321_c0_g1_i1::g.138091::m.138091